MIGAAVMITGCGGGAVITTSRMIGCCGCWASIVGVLVQVGGGSKVAIVISGDAS
jgi:hypothetical protein